MCWWIELRGQRGGRHVGGRRVLGGFHFWGVRIGTVLEVVVMAKFWVWKTGWMRTSLRLERGVDPCMRLRDGP
jgi:hypothetical protein